MLEESDLQKPGFGDSLLPPKQIKGTTPLSSGIGSDVQKNNISLEKAIISAKFI